MRVFAAVAVAGLLAAPTYANDTSVQLTTNGLEFVANDNISMQSEDLFISADEIRVKYVFRNNSDEDIRQLVAFPMPDITYSYGGPVSYPSGPLDNLFEFTTTFDGKELPATLYEYAFAAGVDRTALLKKIDIPLVSFADETQEALEGLAPKAKAELERLGLVWREVFDIGDGTVQDTTYPLWTYRASYVWEATFPANDTVVVEHKYKPSVGGTTGTNVLLEGDPENGWDPQKDYAEKYCVDDTIRNAVRKSIPKGEEYAPYWDNWISYIVSTGNNWAGGYIENFRLVVDKGDEKNLVSFCADGVKKIGPTTFEMVKTEYWAEGEIEILLLRHSDTFMY
jgi:hypothetical protein